MKGDPKVIAILNEVLKAELTAINQYFVHAEMLENWGYHALANYTRKESIGEMKHAEAAMERIFYLDGMPTMEYFELNVGKDVKTQFENDLALEVKAVKRLNDGIAYCVQIGDNGTRELLAKILTDEEEHIDFLEAQLTQIEQMGIQNFLAQQIGENEGGGH